MRSRSSHVVEVKLTNLGCETDITNQKSEDGTGTRVSGCAWAFRVRIGSRLRRSHGSTTEGSMMMVKREGSLPVERP